MSIRFRDIHNQTTHKQTMVALDDRKFSSTYQKYTYTNKRQVTIEKDAETEKFLGNFNPETSFRERKKLMKKMNPNKNVYIPPGALYDDRGIHLLSGVDLCDCLILECPGCFFECKKCRSPKCGFECRVYRKFSYDEIAFNGCDFRVKNPYPKY